MPFLDNFLVGGATGDIVKIAELPLTGSVVTINNIPQTYRHLRMFIVARGIESAVNTLLYIRFNNIASNDYWMNNSTTPISSFDLAYIPANNADLGFYSTVDLFIGDYTNENIAKSIQALQVSKWRKNEPGSSFASGGTLDKTNAVKSISIWAIGGFAENSSVVLYGIK